MAGYLLSARSHAVIPAGAGETFTYNVRVNAVNQLTIQVGGAADTEGQDDNRIAFAAGDEISVQIIISLNGAVTQHTVTLLIEITPP